MKNLSKMFYISIVAFVLFFLLSITKVSAASVNNIIAGTRYVSINGSQTSQSFTPPSNTPLMIVSSGIQYTSYSLNGIQFVFNSPIQGVGLSYIIELSFTIGLDGLGRTLTPSNNFIDLAFEQGSISSKIVSYSYTAVGTSAMNVTMRSAVNLQNSTSLSSIFVALMDGIAACSNSPGSMSQVCGSSVNAQLSNVKIDVTISQDPNTALLYGINSSLSIQTEWIKDQTDWIKEGNNQIKGAIDNQTNAINENTQAQKETNDLIKDATPPNVDNVIDGVGWLPPGPLDSIINLPIVLFNNITDNLAGTCVPLDVNLPYVDKEVNLPCVYDFYTKIGADGIVNSIGVIFSALALYKYFIYLYRWFSRVLSLDNTDNGWGGL